MNVTPDDMIRMRKAGFTHREIAEIAGPPWTRSKVTAFFGKIGRVQPEQKIVISSRRPLKYDFPRDLLMEMYWGCELSRAEMAYELDVPEPSLQQIFRRLKIPTRTTSQSRRIALVRYPHTAVGPTLEQQRAGARAAAKARSEKRRRQRANAARRERRAQQRERQQEQQAA